MSLGVNHLLWKTLWFRHLITLRMVAVLAMRLISVQTVLVQPLPTAAKGTPKLATTRGSAVTAGSVAEMDFVEHRTYELVQVTILRRFGKLGALLIAKDGNTLRVSVIFMCVYVCVCVCGCGCFCINVGV